MQTKLEESFKKMTTYENELLNARKGNSANVEAVKKLERYFIIYTVNRPPKIKQNILYFLVILRIDLVYKSRSNNLARFVVSKTRLIHRNLR